MIPSSSQLGHLVEALWEQDALDLVSIASLIKKDSSLEWLTRVEATALNIGLDMMMRSKDGLVAKPDECIFPSTWFLDEKRGIFQSLGGKTEDAVFLQSFAKRFRGTSVKLSTIVDAMGEEWLLTLPQVVRLFQAATYLPKRLGMDARQRWFFVGNGQVQVRSDLGATSWEMVFGRFGHLLKDPVLTGDSVLLTPQDVSRKSNVSHESSDDEDSEKEGEEDDSRLGVHGEWASKYATKTPPEKAKVNDEIVEDLQRMGVRANATALLLDAEQAYSSKTLIDFGFAPCRIHVPNPDKKICATLSGLGVSAFPMALKTLLLREDPLGTDLDLVFQDTCATLKGNRFYSPRDDMALLFRRRMFAHRALYVLEISARAPNSVVDKGVEQETLGFVHRLAAENAYIIRSSRHYAYKNTLGGKGGRKKRGGLMWVFFFELEDGASTLAQKEAYAKEVLTRMVPSVNFRTGGTKAFQVIVERYDGNEGDIKHRARICFPTATPCGAFMKEWVIPDLTSISHAYCIGCDEERAGGNDKDGGIDKDGVSTPSSTTHKPVCVEAFSSIEAIFSRASLRDKRLKHV